MAIRAVRIDGAHTAGVSAESFDAEIKHQVPVTSVHSEKPIAGVHHLKSTAAGIWLDPDTKNQMPKDNVPLDDIYFTVITKPLYDDAELLDVFASAFNTPKEDVFNFVDTFSKVVEYKREFTDGFTLDDLASVNKDFFGDKSNITRVEDIYQTVFNKPLPGDSLGFTENFKRVLHYLRNFNDNGYIFEDEALYAVVKNIQDFIGSLEEVIASEFKKDLNTDTLTPESVTTLHPTLDKADDFNFSDTDSYSATLSKSDDFSYTDESITTFTKTLADAFALDDLAQIGKDFYGDKGNVFAFEDVFQRSVVYQRIFSADTFEFTDGETVDTVLGKSDPVLMGDSLDKDTTYSKADNYTFTDVHQTVTTLPKEDDYHFTDTSNSNLAKAVQHTFGFGDTFARSVDFKRVFNDYFGLDDAALINKDYTGNKGNIFSFSEDFARAIQYKRSFTVGTIEFTEESTVGINLSKSDPISMSELLDKSSTKTLIEPAFSILDYYNAMRYIYDPTGETGWIPIFNPACIDFLHTLTPEGAFIGDIYNGSVPPVEYNIGFSWTALFYFNLYGPTYSSFVAFPDILARIYYLIDKGASLGLELSDISQTDTVLPKEDTTYVDDEIGKGVSKEFKVNFYHLGEPTVVNETSFINNSIHSVEIAIARLANGTNIHVWSQDLAQNSIGIWGKIYNGNVPIGDAFQINTHTPLIQTQPAVAALSDGGFVVTWSSYKQEGYYNNIYGRRYDNQGAAQTTELEIATWMFGEERESEVLGLPGGGYVVAYVSATRLIVRVFNDNDLSIAYEVVHETYHVVKLPKLLLLTSGDFVVTFYAEYSNSGYNSGYIKARNYTALGVPVVPPGLTFDDAYTVGFSGFSQKSHIVSLSDGGFVALWTDSVTQQIKGRVFPSDRASNSITDVYQLDYSSTINDYISIEKMSGDTCLIAGPGNNTDLLAPKVVVVDLLTGNYLSVHVNLDLVSSNYYIGEVAISITAEEIVAFSWVVDRGNGTEILHQRYNAQELPLGEMETPIYLADSSTLQPNLGKSDSFSYTDNQSNTLHKLLQHSFTLDDATTVNKDYLCS